MKIIESVVEMQAFARARKQTGARIGLVPTMGYLHEGHLSLIHAIRPRCDLLVVSIFVNPTQFGPHEDLATYPRNFERDRALCAEAGADAIFYPSPEGMYAPDHSVYVSEDALSSGLCGDMRPGHFRGVMTVVAKLFNSVLPDVAVFGQKDAQQAAVIRRMVRDLNFPVEVIVAPIVREADGLAMSSRNTYLSPDERVRARSLSRALQVAESRYADGCRTAAELRRAARRVLDDACPDAIDYVAVVDAETLAPVERIERPALIALAVRFGRTRLIDNTIVGG